MSRPRFYCNGGFTLIETLIAITLFAIVMTCSYGVFSMGIQIWKRTTTESRIERKVAMTLEKIRADVQESLPVPETLEGGLLDQRQMTYEADQRGFLFPAVIDQEDEKANAVYQWGAQGYRWDSARGVLCRQTLTSADFLIRREASCVAILEKVRSVEFEYLVPNPITKSHSWYRDWKGKDGIPRAVRMRLEMEPEKPKKLNPVKIERTYWIPVSDPPMDDFIPGASS